MAELRGRTLVIEWFKRLPALFFGVRALYRIFHPLPTNVLRIIFPSFQTFGMSRGFYLGDELVRSGARPGRVILESQISPRFPDDTLVRLSEKSQDRYQPWPVFWLHERDAYLSGKSLCLRDSQARLMAESTFSRTGDRSDPAYLHFATPPQLTLTGNVTSVISRWVTPNYWHWPMDGLSRLALLPEFPSDIKILVPPLRSWMVWFLCEMGLEGRWIETSATAVRIENYYFASPSTMTGCYNPFAVRFLRETFLPKQSVGGGKPRRIYCVREGLTRGVRNEEDVRAFFRKRGWALIAPETLPIPEQIELFAGAEAVVALHGSALTNLLWCSPGCRVVEFAPDNFLSGAFEVVARVLDLRHDFMICPADNRTYVQVDLAVLDRKLAALGV